MPSKNPEITDCAERNDREGVLRCLVNKHPIDETRSDGRSAFLVACLNGHFEIVKLLFENNANIFLKNNKGSNAILHAAYKNHYEIVSFLVSKGVNANECDSQGRNGLHLACIQGANETIMYLLTNNAIKDVNAKTNDKKDALLLSIEGNCSVNTVLELLANGANIQTRTTDGRNVLMECAKFSRTKLFHVLYRYSNLNVNIKDSNDNCCIHYACESGNLHILRSLLHRGALVRVHNKKGQYPKDIAEENDHLGCMKMIEAVSSPPSEPVIENILLSGEEEDAAVVIWRNPRLSNYYPNITAIEIQLKQQRLFDQWKTVSTIQMNDTPFKEKEGRMKIAFEDGELTDCESESDLEERNEVEMNCSYLSGRQVSLDTRMELSNQEHLLPRYQTIRDLQSSSKYVVRVRLANKYGWGNYSQGSSFCLRDMHTVFREPDIRTPRVLRSSLMIKQVQVKPKNDIDWSNLDNTMLTGISEALENQRTVKVVAPINPTECLTRLLSEGISYLNHLLKDEVDLSQIRNANGMSLLHAAAASTSPNAMELITEVVHRNLLSVNDRSKNGSIPLHYAIYNKNMNAAVFLIDNQSDLTAVDANGLTPFLLAVQRGDLQLCALLIEKMPRECIFAVDKSGRNALIHAINSSHIHVADFLISNYGFDPSVKLPPPHEWNLLFFAVNTKNDTVVKYCLEKGVSPLEDNSDGMNAIDYSREKGTDQITSLLEYFGRAPGSVEDVSIQCSHSQAVLTITLPDVGENHPLFELTRVEVSYKKNVMLSTSLTEAATVGAHCKEVNIILGNLSPETQYKCKIRCFNKNGPSKWKGGFDFVTKSEDDDSILTKTNDQGDESEDVYSIVNQVIRSVELNGSESLRKDNSIIQLIDSMQLKELEAVPNETLQTTRDQFNLPCFHHLLLTSGIHSREEVHVCLNLLLQKECDINESVNAFGLISITPIDCACIVADGQFIPFLMVNGGLLNHSQVLNLPSSIFYSLLAPSPYALETVLNESAMTLTQISKRQPLLHILAKIHKHSGVETIASQLIEQGIDKNEIADGSCALHACVTHHNYLLLSYLLKIGAKQEVLDSRGKTPCDLAEENSDGRAIEIFMNTYRCPFPVSSVHLLSYSQTTLLVHWSPPAMPIEIPGIQFYEVELFNSNTCVSLQLPSVKTLYCFVDIPACYHMWVTARVRCHNENGWSEWSMCGSFMESKEKLVENDYLTWLLCHDCEDCYHFLKQNEFISVEDFAEMSDNELRELDIPFTMKEKLRSVLPLAIDHVRDDAVSLAELSKSHFAWK